MGLFGGGSPAEKAQKLRKKVTEKYGDATARQKAIQQVGELKDPAAVTVLLARFTITVDPHTTDEDEKEHVFQLVKGFGHDAIAPITEFLRTSDQASSWALRLLEALLPETEVVKIATELLTRLGAEYSRNPEKKQVLVQYLESRDDPRIGPAILPLLDDMSDDVKLSAIKALGAQKYEAAREPLLELLVAEETGRRLRSQLFETLHQMTVGVQGYREKVEALLSEPYFVDKAGLIKKRS